MTIGVITASNSIYWPTLSATVEVCIENDIPMAVADHGLSAEHRQILEEKKIIILDNTIPPDLAELIKTNHTEVSCPEAWTKPYICQQSPFDDNVWIDADAIPINNLSRLFQFTELHGAWLTRNHWSIHNRNLYRKLVEAYRPINEDRYGVACQINTGIFGFRKGMPWIDEWAKTIKTVLTDGTNKLSITRDQSALILTFSRVGKIYMPLLLWNEKYNYAANGLMAPDRFKRKKYMGLEGAELLAAVRADHPNINVVHWMGRPKSWD